MDAADVRFMTIMKSTLLNPLEHLTDYAVITSPVFSNKELLKNFQHKFVGVGGIRWFFESGCIYFLKTFASVEVLLNPNIYTPVLSSMMFMRPTRQGQVYYNKFCIFLYENFCKGIIWYFHMLSNRRFVQFVNSEKVELVSDIFYFPAEKMLENYLLNEYIYVRAYCSLKNYMMKSVLKPEDIQKKNWKYYLASITSQAALYPLIFVFNRIFLSNLSKDSPDLITLIKRTFEHVEKNGYEILWTGVALQIFVDLMKDEFFEWLYKKAIGAPTIEVETRNNLEDVN